MGIINDKMYQLYNNCFSKKKWYYLAYTVLFLISVFAIFSFYFFSGKTVIWEVDGWEQHFKSYIYYSKYLREILNNIFIKHELVIPMWDYAIGEGNDILATFHYYCIGDPFTVLCVFFTEKNMYIYYTLMIFLRIYLAGVSFSEFCFYLNKKKEYVFIGGFVYGICYWCILNCCRHPFFLNPMVYLPLLLLGIEKVLRERKPCILILSVFIAGISNFYFFYILALICIVYVGIRLIYSFKRDIRRIAVNFIHLLIPTLIGILMSGIILIPMIYVFVTNSRITADNSFSLSYPFYYYLKLPMMFVGSGFTFWTCMGFTYTTLMAVFLAFINRKKYTLSKVYFIISLIFLCIPFCGKIFNGFSYSTNRWSFAFALVCAYLLVEMLPVLLNLSKKNAHYLLTLTIAFSIICLIIPYSANLYNVILSAMAIIMLVVISPNRKGNYYISYTSRWITVFVFTLAGLILNAYYKDSSYGLNYISECVSVNQAVNEVYSEETDLIKNETKKSNIDIDTVRYMGDGLSYNDNCISGISSSGLYWTLVNPYVSQFRNDTGMIINTLLPHKFMGYDSRVIPSILSSTDYMVEDKNNTDDTLIPYGFEKISEDDNYILYKNTNSLPLGYAYNNCISYKDWMKLCLAKRQEALLTDMVIDTEQNNVANDSSTSKSLKYRMSFTSDDISMKGNSFIVTKENSSVTFYLDEEGAGEYYLSFSGFDFLGTQEYLLYDENEKFDPFNLYNKNSWNKLSNDEKIRIKKDYYFWNKSISSVDLSISTEDYVGNKGNKVMKYFTPSYSFYNNQHDFYCNLGYSEDGLKTITITFPMFGVYYFDSLEIVVQDMESVVDKVNILKKKSMYDINTGTNSFSGTINMKDKGYLCIAIPYSPGWKAYVDGVETSLYCANICYMGIDVMEGEHRITLKYETPLLKQGVLISVIGIITMFLYCYFIKKYRSREENV